MTDDQLRTFAQLVDKIGRFRAMVERMEKVAADLPDRDLTPGKLLRLTPEGRLHYDERTAAILPDHLIELVIPAGDICNLFSMLVATYALPPAAQGRVEQASRFLYYALPLLGEEPKRPIKRFRRHLRIYQRHLRTADYAMRVGVLRREPRRNPSRPRFEIVFLKTYSPKLTQLILGEVRALEARLCELGWQRLIYGRIFLGRTMGIDGWSAFYDVQDDVIFASCLTSKTVPLLRENLAHEIGHRLDFRFLQGHTEEIVHVFLKMKEAERAPYAAFGLLRQALFGNSAAAFPFDLFHLWYKLVELIPEAHRRVFPTWYAEIHPMENFAEMFRERCFGRWRDLPHQRQFLAVTQLASATRADRGFMPAEYQRFGVPLKGMR